MNRIIDSIQTNEIDRILKKYNMEGTDLLQILLEVQDLHPENYIPESIAYYVSEELNLTLAKVYAVISFFAALSAKPRGRHVIRICQSTACLVNDYESLKETLERILSIKAGETTVDKDFSIEMTECIGACDIAPAFKINHDVYGNLTEERIVEILNSYRTVKKKEATVMTKEFAHVEASKTVKVFSKYFGAYDPDDFDAYIATGGFESLKKVFAMDREEAFQIVDDSELRGRGGAAYPTGRKLRQSFAVPGDRKAVICNADEGEPGTFKDRQFLEYDPLRVIEGMIISAYIVKGTEGYIYIRHEYTHLHDRIQNLLDTAKDKGYLGKNILGSGFDFDIRLFSGAGAYVCGEGGALIESIEGNQGYPRKKPPFTKERGLFQLPTLVINVETLGGLTTIFDIGVEEYTSYGTEKSKGTKVISLSGSVNRPGAYEIEFGMTLDQIINELGQGIRDNKRAKFLQIGGASGPIIPANKFDLEFCYEKLWDHGFDVGSGAIVVADEDVSLAEYLLSAYEFFKEESCGKCTPCREGQAHIAHILEEYIEGNAPKSSIETALKLAKHMKDSAFCGLGRTAPAPLISADKNCYFIL